MNINQFRCWDKVKKKYVDAFAIDCDGDLLLWDWNDGGDKSFIYAGNGWRDKYSVQRFTGLCDSDSVKIYEGDIITTDEVEPDQGVRIGGAITWDYGAFGMIVLVRGLKEFHYLYSGTGQRDIKVVDSINK